MKKTDIAPEMLENIKKEFEDSIRKDGIILNFRNQIKDGKADYVALHNTASSVGENLSKAFNKYISPEILPNEKMYLNIAQKVLTPMFEEDYEIIATLGTELQKSLNKNVGLNLKGIKPDINKSRIDGIVTKISSYDNYKQGAWLLGEPCINYSQSVVDDVVRTNAEFHAKAGIRATIERTPVGEPCKYCAALAGRYTYPNVPDDVYRRHRSCRCLVIYNPGNGKRQNVHTKKWIEPKSSEKIATRKALSKPIGAAKTKEKVKANLEKLKATKTAKERVAENLSKIKETTPVKERVKENLERLKGGIQINAPGSSKSFKKSLEQIKIGKAGLDSRRKNILSRIPNSSDYYRYELNSLTTRDLAYLSAETKHEFALFRSKREDILIHGDARNCDITGELAEEILNKKYEWIAHSHVDGGKLYPSSADKELLKQLGQKKSVIVGIDGDEKPFDNEI